MNLRRASLDELAAIVAVDREAVDREAVDREAVDREAVDREAVAHAESRIEWLRRRIERGECVVAVVDDADPQPQPHTQPHTHTHPHPHPRALAGFIIDDDAFFDRTFIRLVAVANQHRRRGVANALVADAESRARTPTVFSSSNRSNTAMHALLRKRGWVESGVIEGLDELDPEIVFRKRVR